MNILKISSNKLPVRYVHKIADLLVEHGLDGEVVPNLSVVKGKVERGAEIRLFNASAFGVRLFFIMLRSPTTWGKAAGIHCAWLEAEDGYSGCILKWPEWTLTHGNDRDCSSEQ